MKEPKAGESGSKVVVIDRDYVQKKVDEKKQRKARWNQPGRRKGEGMKEVEEQEKEGGISYCPR